MDQNLIEAAARLCGWELRGARYERQDGLEMAWVGLPVEDASITGAGLLALEDALWREKWYVRWNGEYIWQKHPAMRRTPVAHMDRATAACLAAQQEVGDE